MPVAWSIARSMPASQPLYLTISSLAVTASPGCRSIRLGDHVFEGLAAHLADLLERLVFPARADPAGQQPQHSAPRFPEFHVARSSRQVRRTPSASMCGGTRC